MDHNYKGTTINFNLIGNNLSKQQKLHDLQAGFGNRRVCEFLGELFMCT